MQIQRDLEQFIRQSVPSPKEEEIEEIHAIFKYKKFNKGAFFKTPYTIGREVVFIAQGAIRVVIYSNQGEETTVRIREKDILIADPFKLLKATESAPIEVGIECLEDFDALVCPVEKFSKILENNLTLNIVVRQHLTQQLIQIGQQLLLFLTGNASDRYQQILNNQPNLIKKFPLHFIASMIGITPTQLSRVRNKKHK